MKKTALQSEHVKSINFFYIKQRNLPIIFRLQHINDLFFDLNKEL